MKRLKFWRALGIIMVVGMVLVSLATVAFAQPPTVPPEKRIPTEKGTPTETTKLEDIVVTATRVERPIEDVAVSVSVVTREEMEKKSRVTFVDEALKYEAGVAQLRRKFADAWTRATLRGFSGAGRTLVLIDGIPLNDPYFGGTQLCNLPVGDIQRIEIAKGPFSSLYGGEAMGGAINIITQTPKKETFQIKSSVSAYNTYHHMLNYGNKLGRLSFSINLEKRASEGDRPLLVTKSVGKGGTATTKVTGWIKTKDPTGKTTYIIGDTGKSYWDQEQYSCKFTLALNEASNLSFLYRRNIRELGFRDPQSKLIDQHGRSIDGGIVELPGEGTMSISVADFLGHWAWMKDNIYGLGYDTLLGNIALKGKLNFIDVDRFLVRPHAGASYHGGPGKIIRLSPLDTFCGEAQVDIPVGDTNLVTAGLSYRNDWVKLSEQNLSNWRNEKLTIGRPTYEIHGKVRTIAFYTQGEVQLIDTLKLFCGARYDMWENYDASLFDEKGTPTKHKQYEDREKRALSPKIGLLYKPEFKIGLYKLDRIRASWGKAFRPPTISELYRTWTFWGITREGNPELSPEMATSWEIGVDQRLGKIALSTTYFQSKIEDLIYYRLIAEKHLRKKNAGEGKIRGFESEIKINLTPSLNIFGNYTLQETEIAKNPADPKTVGKDFEFVPEKMFNIGISFSGKALSASCVYHWKDAMYATPDNSDVVKNVYGAYDKVATIDLKIGYTFLKNLELSIAVDNLLDKEYYQFYKVPGRTITFDVSYKY